MPDQFPEAFRRFTKDQPEAKKASNYQSLLEQFALWAKRTYINSPKQNRAVAVEAEKLGIGGRWREVHFLWHGHDVTRNRDIITGRFVKRETI